LAFFADLTHQEVARALKVPLGTAKTRIRSGLRSMERHLGGLVALMLLALGGAGTWVYQRQGATEALQRRAIHLLADSQTKALRLVPAGGPSAPEAGLHATLRSAPGADLAVLTLTHFPAPPAGAHHALWIRTRQGWLHLELQPPDSEGKALQILEAPWMAQTWPLELRITEETGSAALPSGQTVAQWSSPVGQPALP
jgi:hypothetical protein